MRANTSGAGLRAWPWLLGISLLAGCQPARLLGPGDRLLVREPRLAGHVLPETPPLYQRSNSRVLGLRLGLAFYSAGDRLLTDTSPVLRRLRQVPKLRMYTYLLGSFLKDKVGEPPFILSERLITQDIAQLEALYAEWGYFQAGIQPRIRRLGRYEAFLVYAIRPGPRWILQDFEVRGGDSLMLQVADSLFAAYGPPVGQPYQLAPIDRYRELLHQALLQKGYYGLPLSSLLIEIDTTTQEAPASHSQKNPFWRRWLGTQALQSPGCHVRLLLPETYRPLSLRQVQLHIHTTDRSPSYMERTQPIPLWTEDRAAAILDGRVLLPRLYTTPGSLYNYKAIQTSQRALQGLSVVQWALPTLRLDDTTHTLDLDYEVLLRAPIDVSINVEGFQSQQILTALPPLPGASVALRWSHSSLFRRGWHVSTRLQGFVSYYRPTATADPAPLYSFLGDISLDIPEKTSRLQAAAPEPLPKTLVSRHTILRFSYQDLRQISFSRRYLTAEARRERRILLYDRREETHILTPLSLLFVQSTFSQVFLDDINRLSPLVRSVILRDFLTRLTQLSAYQITSTHRYFATSRKGWGDFSQSYLELGGVLPLIADHLLSWLRLDSSQKDGFLLDRYQYGFFVRALLEGRLRYGWTEALQLFMRARAGVAWGLLYTRVVPFENRFFVGGPYSMRGWPFGGLGPGIYPLPPNRFLLPGGEILLEANFELRLTFYKGLQLAPFVDVGNVWFDRTSLFDDPRGYLTSRNFRPGVSGGVGLRWDLSFFVIRLDVGQILYDPPTNGLVGRTFRLGGTTSQYHIAIGYPF